MSQKESSEEQQEYEVEKILDKRFHKSRMEYKIKWKEWPEKDCTWEPLCNLKSVLPMIEEFENSLRPKKDKSSHQQKDSSDDEREDSVKAKKNIKKKKLGESLSSSEEDVKKKFATAKKKKITHSDSDSSPEVKKKNKFNVQEQQMSSDDDVPVKKSQVVPVTSAKKSATNNDNKIVENKTNENKVPESKANKTSVTTNENNKQSDTKAKSSLEEKKQGNYDQNDSANEILNVRKDSNSQSLHFFVTWKQRKNNQIPSPTWITDVDIKRHNPEILCDYLLKKIKWPKND